MVSRRLMGGGERNNKKKNKKDGLSHVRRRRFDNDEITCDTKRYFAMRYSEAVFACTTENTNLRNVCCCYLSPMERAHTFPFRTPRRSEHYAHLRNMYLHGKVTRMTNVLPIGSLYQPSGEGFPVKFSHSQLKFRLAKMSLVCLACENKW